MNYGLLWYRADLSERVNKSYELILKTLRSANEGALSPNSLLSSTSGAPVMIHSNQKTMVKKFTHKMISWSKYLLNEIETWWMNDDWWIMTRESWHVNHDTRITTRESRHANRDTRIKFAMLELISVFLWNISKLQQTAVACYQKSEVHHRHPLARIRQENLAFTSLIRSTEVQCILESTGR